MCGYTRRFLYHKCKELRGHYKEVSALFCKEVLAITSHLCNTFSEPFYKSIANASRNVLLFTLLIIPHTCDVVNTFLKNFSVALLGGDFMGNLLEKVLKFMSDYGISAYQLSKQTGIPQSTIGMWKKRGSEPSRESIQKIINAYDMPYDYFRYEDDLEEVDPNWNKIPILGVVPCGVPIETIEDIKGYVEVLPGMKEDHFALIAKGDSMSPLIMSGDIMIVKKTSDISNGKVGIVKVNGDEATCKKIYVDNGGISLIPLNEKYDVQNYSVSDVLRLPVTILGRVKEIRRKL